MNHTLLDDTTSLFNLWRTLPALWKRCWSGLRRGATPSCENPGSTARASNFRRVETRERFRGPVYRNIYSPVLERQLCFSSSLKKSQDRREQRHAFEPFRSLQGQEGAVIQFVAASIFTFSWLI